MTILRMTLSKRKKERERKTEKGKEKNSKNSSFSLNCNLNHLIYCTQRGQRSLLREIELILHVNFDTRLGGRKQKKLLPLPNEKGTVLSSALQEFTV